MVFKMSFTATEKFREIYHKGNLLKKKKKKTIFRTTCRNKNFFFLQGLYSNAKMLLEEGNISKPDISFSNEDSSNRKRSSSLTEQVNIFNFSLLLFSNFHYNYYFFFYSGK